MSSHQGTRQQPEPRLGSFRDHLFEKANRKGRAVIISDDEGSDDELVITRGRRIPVTKARKIIRINQVQQAASRPLRLQPGSDVKLTDQSFIRIVEYIPNSAEGPFIRGHRLLFQNHWELLMQERKNELVQLVKINDKMEVEDSMSTVPVHEVVGNCTVIFTNQEYPDLQYRKHIEVQTGDDQEQDIYFCRFKSADCNVASDERDPSRPPKMGRIERLHQDEADNGVLVTQTGEIEFAIPDPELRRRWRGVGRSQSKKYTFGDAFCGAGGTSSGAFQAGLKLKFSIDFDKAAIQTYRRNFGMTKAEILREDVAEFIRQASSLEGESIVDYLHMSPPCQPFCGCNRNPNREKNQKDIDSFSRVSALIEVCKPRIVTLEEAKSLTDIDKRKYFRKLISGFIRKGYSVQWKVVELSKYGVPQTRNRTIIIASGPGEKLPPFVQPTHGTGPGLLPIPTINSTIDTIPADAEHQDEIPEMRSTKDAYAGDKLCQTIMTAVKPYHYHPSGTRRFSIREYASLQTFEPTFTFEGTITEKLKQIGNAVPPLFAKTLFVHLKAALGAADDAEDMER
ncbi:hypothetical protein Z517_10837 [Fonsecaea pedrosoi CBS 271.37]|uniref:DNA (cytosine-5-)-methyltransferase n=1 Tax=Fonsecaea pedrosoi CBS 271.37 TaxID=1442368 RepID=A0A0D2ENZ0_9EURO|nr:uncharacterized protein Z517_10837 [Fonsecaea pedrosoi CBS 271.37]KIW76092.1 hypothetical protein Z517_10837 [Fonsecaea pedrosoi CBS 271.37]